MQFSFNQHETDKRNYVAEFAHFLQGEVKTSEALEQRADVLAVEFAMQNKGVYDAKSKTFNFDIVVVDVN
ncbi:MAG: hypothetical protein MUP81_03215 [Dehalococcoidia bacterium]|nr:hypothetical protein [Dehalococcoidia bacterium]